MANGSIPVRVPEQFIPLIDAEMSRRGYFTRIEAVAHILEDYFRDHPVPPNRTLMEVCDDAFQAGQGPVPAARVRPRIRG